MPIKILHISDSMNMGGPENGLVNIINRLDSNKYSHVICCIREIGTMASRITSTNTELISLNNAKRDYLMPFKLSKVIRRNNPDIIHTRNWGTIDGVLGAILAGYDSIIHGEHGREWNDTQGLNWKRNHFRKLLSRKIYKFIAVSEEIKRWLIDTVGISEHRVIRIFNGVDTKKFEPPESKGISKARMGFDPDQFLIGTVGRLERVKNYDMFLNSLGGLGNILPNCKAVFVGDGPDMESLKIIASSRNLNVDFIGVKDNIADYLQAFDVFINTSVIEGIANVILEAMAAGLPVLATNVGGNPELVENGITGYLIPLNDHCTLADRINTYFNNRQLRENHGKSARIKCERQFSLDQMVVNYDRLYSQLFSRS